MLSLSAKHEYCRNIDICMIETLSRSTFLFYYSNPETRSSKSSCSRFSFVSKPKVSRIFAASFAYKSASSRRPSLAMMQDIRRAERASPRRQKSSFRPRVRYIRLLSIKRSLNNISIWLGNQVLRKEPTWHLQVPLFDPSGHLSCSKL